MRSLLGQPASIFISICLEVRLGTGDASTDNLVPRPAASFELPALTNALTPATVRYEGPALVRWVVLC